VAGRSGHSRDEGSGAVRPGALSALLQEIAAAPASPDWDWESGLRSGAVVGRFELVREIGRGGFGVVWEAKDRELGRRVAFKAVRAGSRRGLREERLLREAETAARLSHPNIVTLHDVGRSEHGPYLVLELLQGKTLAERLAQGALTVREAVRIGVEVARGLAHAHEHGVVHRDLKPENVFLCDDGQVKVLDFGLAHAFGHRRADGGTPSYMAPEQLEGAPEDERTDVFALGVILHEMLSGKRPFEDERALRSGARAPTLDVPGEPALGDLVAGMLEKQPVRRPREAGGVLAALSSFASEPERAEGPSGGVRTRRRSRRAPAALAAAAVLILAAAGLATRRSTPAARADGRVVVAVADMVNETGELELDVLSGLLVTSLEQSRRLAVMTRARVLDLAVRGGRRGAERVDEAIGREVGRAHGVRALLLPAVRRLGSTYSMEVRAIDPRRDEHLFTVSDRATSKEALLDLLDRLSDRVRRELREGANEVGEARIALGAAMTPSLEAYQHYVAGVEAWHRDALRAVGLREFREALGLDPRFAAVHGELAALYEAYGRTDLAEPHWRAASDELDRMPAKERSLLRLARAHAMPSLEHWSPEDALRLADELVDRYAEDKFVLASAAAAYERFGRRERGHAVLRAALELDPGFFYAAKMLNDALGDGVPETLEVARRAVATRRSAANLALLAEALRANGSDEESPSVAREALRVDGGRNSLVVLNSCAVLHDAGAGAECAAVWERMLGSGLNEHERDFARLQLATSLAAQGRRREARRVLLSVEEARRGHPSDVAQVLSIGRPRLDSPESVQHARRIPQPMFRRNFLAFFGAMQEAEQLARTVPGGAPLADRAYRFLVLLERGSLVEALEEIRVQEEEIRRRNVSFALFGAALLRAEALLALGRDEDAANVRPVALPCRCTDQLDHAANYPRLALIRARALERLARRADAVRELDGVLAFWKDADADLPLLVEARAMRKRLAGAPRVRTGARRARSAASARTRCSSAA
jgi:tetratricopeptide (TPR) repeat protein